MGLFLQDGIKNPYVMFKILYLLLIEKENFK